MFKIRVALLAILPLLASTAGASILGSISGLIHDPQHRPVQGAQVTLRSTTSDWSKSATSDNAGEFRFDSVPLGDYRVTVELAGFATQAQKLTVTSGHDARLHFPLTIGQSKET
ncbi:MAG TPA: carboxypeptidase-like regulatory domain-containing protein, partial [Terriglobales bacterium]|nr:carboxypeptidase-like regulatory domain-containing protein [Terriglobales bacterium]